MSLHRHPLVLPLPSGASDKSQTQEADDGAELFQVSTSERRRACHGVNDRRNVGSRADLHDGDRRCLRARRTMHNPTPALTRTRLEKRDRRRRKILVFHILAAPLHPHPPRWTAPGIGTRSARRAGPDGPICRSCLSASVCDMVMIGRARRCCVLMSVETWGASRSTRLAIPEDDEGGDTSRSPAAPQHVANFLLYAGSALLELGFRVGTKLSAAWRQVRLFLR